MKDSIVSYKGFDKNMKCRDFQYQIGETFTHKGKVKQCSSGFHACPAPLATFGCYAPADSRFCVVEQSGDMSEDDDCEIIDIKAAKAGVDIEPDTYYKLVNGEFVKCDDE